MRSIVHPPKLFHVAQPLIRSAGEPVPAFLAIVKTRRDGNDRTIDALRFERVGIHHASAYPYGEEHPTKSRISDFLIAMAKKSQLRGCCGVRACPGSFNPSGSSLDHYLARALRQSSTTN